VGGGGSGNEPLTGREKKKKSFPSESFNPFLTNSRKQKKIGRSINENVSGEERRGCTKFCFVREDDRCERKINKFVLCIHLRDERPPVVVGNHKRLLPPASSLGVGAGATRATTGFSFFWFFHPKKKQRTRGEK
jgi:hypothetical protein